MLTWLSVLPVSFPFLYTTLGTQFLTFLPQELLVGKPGAPSRSGRKFRTQGTAPVHLELNSSFPLGTGNPHFLLHPWPPPLKGLPGHTSDCSWEVQLCLQLAPSGPRLAWYPLLMKMRNGARVREVGRQDPLRHWILTSGLRSLTITLIYSKQSKQTTKQQPPKRRVLEKMWWKWNSCTLLLGMQNAIAAVENGIETIYKLRSLLGLYPK